MAENSANVFTEVYESHGLLTAGFATASLISFLFALPGGFHLANRPLMMAGVFFFIACGPYLWRNRDGSEVTYTNEKVSPVSRFLGLSWSSALGVLLCFLVAAMFACVAWLGHLPTRISP
jgi:hypothetical protein